jgi:hypothetical protein
MISRLRQFWRRTAAGFTSTAAGFAAFDLLGRVPIEPHRCESCGKTVSWISHQRAAEWLDMRRNLSPVASPSCRCGGDLTPVRELGEVRS